MKNTLVYYIFILTFCSCKNYDLEVTIKPTNASVIISDASINLYKDPMLFGESNKLVKTLPISSNLNVGFEKLDSAHYNIEIVGTQSNYSWDYEAIKDYESIRPLKGKTSINVILFPTVKINGQIKIGTLSLEEQKTLFQNWMAQEENLSTFLAAPLITIQQSNDDSKWLHSEYVQVSENGDFSFFIRSDIDNNLLLSFPVENYRFRKLQYEFEFKRDNPVFDLNQITVNQIDTSNVSILVTILPPSIDEVNLNIRSIGKTEDGLILGIEEILFHDNGTYKVYDLPAGKYKIVGTYQNEVVENIVELNQGQTLETTLNFE